MGKKLFYLFSIILFVFIGLYLFSNLTNESILMPVKGADRNDYDQNSFGAPRVGHKHKGVDVFAKMGTPVQSASKGIVIYTGVLSLGGNVVLVLSPGLRMYYYAHLNEISAKKLQWVGTGDLIGTVGKTGNARNTPPHLHFSISHFNFPFKKSFVDPVPLLNEYCTRAKKNS